jgi:hypothetical protein
MLKQEYQDDIIEEDFASFPYVKMDAYQYSVKINLIVG